MAKLTKTVLLKEIKRYAANNDMKTAKNLYNNFKEEFKLTESFQEIIKDLKKK